MNYLNPSLNLDIVILHKKRALVGPVLGGLVADLIGFNMASLGIVAFFIFAVGFFSKERS